MKKLLITALFFIMAIFGFSQTYVDTADVNIAWDVVTQLENGDPIPLTDIIDYEVYTSNYPLVDPQNPAAHQLISATGNLNENVVFIAEGEFAMGVRTVRTTSGGRIEYSDITWSNISGTPGPFVVRVFFRPVAPTGLRVQ